MQKSGAAEYLAGNNSYCEWYASCSSYSLFYVITTLWPRIISNNAVVVLIVPIAISVATELHFDPLPFVLWPYVSSSTSFWHRLAIKRTLWCTDRQIIVFRFLLGRRSTQCSSGFCHFIFYLKFGMVVMGKTFPSRYSRKICLSGGLKNRFEELQGHFPLQ